MIAFIGDIHQLFDELEKIIEELPSEVTHVFQVGDLMLHPRGAGQGRTRWRPMARPVSFIDGNHHYYPATRGLTAPTALRQGLTFLPRGTILRVDERRIGFLGGADSVVDRAWRTAGVDWWPDEAISEADRARWARVVPGEIEILVTHTPPASVTIAMTGQPPHPSAVVLEEIWAQLGHPELICGHMHEHYEDDRVEVLPLLGVTYR